MKSKQEYSPVIPAILSNEKKESKYPFHVDMPSYVSGHDIVYLSPSYDGYEGFPLGNGDLGGMVWCSPEGLNIQVNKVDMWDDSGGIEYYSALRSCGRLKIDFGAPCFDWLYLKDFEARLALHDAEAVFTSQTPFMKSSVRSFVAVDKNVWVIQCRNEGLAELSEGSGITVSLERWGSRVFGWWYGKFGLEPEKGMDKPGTKGKGIQLTDRLGIEPEVGLGKASAGIKGKDIYLTEKLGKLDFAVACRVINSPAKPEIVSKHRAELNIKKKTVQDFTVLLSVVTSNESKEPLKTAVSLLDKAESDGINKTRKKHSGWWSDFWKRSFVHIKDNYLENIYYFKRYLMASSSRGRCPAVFNGGIWTWNHDVRNWITPHHWNEQQAYWSLCAENSTDLLKPYIDTYWRILPEAEKSAENRGISNAILVSEKHCYDGFMDWETGSMVNNLTPASQIAGFFWDYYRYTGDKTFLEEKAYPFMKKAAEFYVQYLQWNEEKKEYFIFPSMPYECESGNELLNPITDRVMIESLFKNCISASEIIGTDTEKRSQWQNVVEHLWEPKTENLPGIGEVFIQAFNKNGTFWWSDAGKSLNYHFATHSAIVFPANLVGISQNDSNYFKAAANFVNSHPDGSNAITTVLVVAARLGMAEKLLKCFSNSIRKLQHFPQGLFYNHDGYSQRNYIYDRQWRLNNIPKTDKTTGTPHLPFIQCGLEPLGNLSAAVNEMLVQSYNGEIRIFPAVPDGWDAAFTLNCVGGFLVSSELNENKEARFVMIESVLGNECKLVNPWNDKKIVVESISPGKTKVDFKISNNNLIIFPTKKNTVYMFYPEGSSQYQKQKKFTGERNTKPKYFQEAILGKPRDF